MVDHKEQGAAPGEREPLECSVDESKHNDPTSNRKFAQLDALDRLGLYRDDLDAWDRGGRVGPMPPPDRFRLDLGSLSPRQVLWRST